MEKVDMVIVGTGVAGLFCALHLPRQMDVLLITKDKAENSDSYLAQGGIATLRGIEDYDSYFEDTLRAGHYKNNRKAVEVMIRSSNEIIEELLSYGTDFERTEEGFCYTKEGAHSVPRILYHKDVTGKEITSKLLSAVQKRENTRIEEYTAMLDILCENNVCKGIIVKDRKNQIRAIQAKAVVLATGGIGGLFLNSTNYRHITGDALAIAFNHGIELQDINYIQIHPTVLYSQEEGRKFLISESLRGEGAILLNPEMKRFVDELQPRDIVTEAIREQMQKYGSEYIYLSLQNKDENLIKERFPNIYEHCLEEGYDLSRDYIPVSPAQHYFMGGIKVDLNGRTSMQNLYAVGEASCNGVHGANRLASNSLLESLVFSKRAAEDIVKNMPYLKYSACSADYSFIDDPEILASRYKNLIMNEIKRRDKEFYAKWCTDAVQN